MTKTKTSTIRGNDFCVKFAAKNKVIFEARAVRPVFKQKPAYLNLKINDLLFFHTISIGL